MLLDVRVSMQLVASDLQLENTQRILTSWFNIFDGVYEYVFTSGWMVGYWQLSIRTSVLSYKCKSTNHGLFNSHKSTKLDLR